MRCSSARSKSRRPRVSKSPVMPHMELEFLTGAVACRRRRRGARASKLVVQVQVALDHRVQAEILHDPGAACRAVGLAEGRICEVAQERLLEARGVGGVVQAPVTPSTTSSGLPPTLRGHHGQARRHGLQDRVGDALVQRGQHEHVEAAHACRACRCGRR